MIIHFFNATSAVQKLNFFKFLLLTPQQLLICSHCLSKKPFLRQFIKKKDTTYYFVTKCVNKDNPEDVLENVLDKN